MTSYRMKQTQRGLEAVKFLAEFLESKDGVLSVSIHESNFSTGSNGKPDMVFGAYGIEVKRVEMFSKHWFKSREKFYAHLNNLSLTHEQWDGLKEWCARHFKVPLLVAVLTFGHQPPMFIKLSQSQVDELQKQQAHNKWIEINAWNILLNGERWT